MELKKAINTVHRAIKNFDMIQNGDKIAVGLSGGKDSLLLTACLGLYQKYSKVKFSLTAICIDSFKNADIKSLTEFCKSYDVELKVVKSDIGEIIFDIRKEKNPCSLCAKMRRGMLCSTCQNIGFNKLALGHNADDFIETFLLSIMHENRLNSMKPVSFMSNTKITIIRPLLYLWENQIKDYTKDFPILKSACPVDKKTERENIKNSIKEIEKILPNFKKNLFNSIFNYEKYNLINL